MFSVWLAFTSNMNSQTTWLKVKLKLCNFSSGPFSLIYVSFFCCLRSFSFFFSFGHHACQYNDCPLIVLQCNIDSSLIVLQCNIDNP